MPKVITIKSADGAVVASDIAPEGSSKMTCVKGKACFYTCTQEGRALVSGEHIVYGSFLGEVIAICPGMEGLILLQNMPKPLYHVSVESDIIRQMSGARGSEGFFKKARFQTKSSPNIDISYWGNSSVHVTIPAIHQVMLFNLGKDCIPVIGNGKQGFTTGGNAMGVMLNSPGGVCKAADLLLVSDRGNKVLRMFSGNGIEMTSTGVIGDPDLGESIDGPFSTAGFEDPSKMDAYGDFAVLVDGNKVRFVNMRTKTVSTIYKTDSEILSVSMASPREILILENSDAQD